MRDNYLPQPLSFRFRLSRPAFLLALYVLAGFLTRAVILGADIANTDESSYMVGAREILRGHVPYTAFADNKPPLIYMYYALTQFVGASGLLGVRLFTNLVTVPLTAFALSTFYRHDKRGIAAALAYLIYSASYEGSNMLAVNCELVMMLPLAWALVCVRDGAESARAKETFAAGALLGLATLVKYQAGLWGVPMLVALVVPLWRRRPGAAFARASMLVAGAFMPLVVTVVLFAMFGGVEGLLYWNVTHNVGYVLNPTTVSDAIYRAISQGVPFATVTAVLWFGWASARHFGMSQDWHLLISGTLAASVVASTLGFRFFPHYFVQLYVPLALGSAPWLASVCTLPLSRRGRLVIGSALATFAGFSISNAVLYVHWTPHMNTVSRAVAERLHRDPCYGTGSMFVWGSIPLLYYHANLPLASRFFFPEFPLVAYTSGNPSATARHVRGLVRDRRGRHWRWLMTDLESSDPTYILDTSDAHLSMWEYFPLADYPLLERFVHSRYSMLDTVADVRIYRRNGCHDVPVIARR